MTLSVKQAGFTKLVAQFIQDLAEAGYSVTFGEAWRSPETCSIYAKQGRGIAKSLHQHRLAIDLNLFKGGKFLTDSADYEEAGKIWESYSVPGFQCCWGGRFESRDGQVRPDGNHFSIAHDGLK